MREIILGIALALTLTACDYAQDTNSPVEPTKPCKHITADACNSDPACGWDQYGGTDNSGKCKLKEQIKPANPH